MRLTLLVLLFLFLVPCCTTQQRAGWEIGSTLQDYQGQLLLIPDGPGRDRLDIEKRYDPTIRNFIAMNGDPDYIYVESRLAVQLIFIDDDRIVRFQRPKLNPKSRAIITDGVPDALVSLFSREDQFRIGELRAAGRSATAVPAE